MDSALHGQQDKPKKSRTSAQKVQTGCITCKKRHIKCDETKPHCSNCLKTRGHCEGYAIRTRKKSPGPVQIRWNVSNYSNATKPKVAIQLQVHPDSVDFQDATSHLYFHEFVRLAQGSWLNAAAKDGLWKVTMPQLVRNNDVFRSAAIAIGALSLWHCQSGSKSLRKISAPSRLISQEEKHYFHALVYYCRSLKLQYQRASPQDAVFLSLLLLVFESLRGNRQAVLDHINHGQTLLLTLLTEKNARSLIPTLAPNPKAFLATVSNVFTQLSTQEKLLDGDIHASSKSVVDSPVYDHIPTVFNTLDDFESYWASNSHRQTKIISIMADAMQTSAGIVEFESSAKDSQTELQLLNAAYMPLFNRIIMAGAGSPDYLKALHFRLQYLAGYVIENPTNYLDVETLSSQTPLFREYLSLAGAALSATSRVTNNPAYSLSLRCDLVWQLFNVAILCRDPLTRDDALGLLRNYPGQDGLWNTVSLYLLALKNRDIERINAQQGTLAEQWSRLRRREFVFEDCGYRILLRYLEENQQTSRWQLVEEVAEVGQELEDVKWVRQPRTGSEGLLLQELYSA